jgi:hypothetical protein
MHLLRPSMLSDSDLFGHRTFPWGPRSEDDIVSACRIRVCHCNNNRKEEERAVEGGLKWICRAFLNIMNVHTQMLRWASC